MTTECYIRAHNALVALEAYESARKCVLSRPSRDGGSFWIWSCFHFGTLSVPSFVTLSLQLAFSSSYLTHHRSTDRTHRERMMRIWTSQAPRASRWFRRPIHQELEARTHGAPRPRVLPSQSNSDTSTASGCGLLRHFAAFPIGLRAWPDGLRTSTTLYRASNGGMSPLVKTEWGYRVPIIRRIRRFGC